MLCVVILACASMLATWLFNSRTLLIAYGVLQIPECVSRRFNSVQRCERKVQMPQGHSTFLSISAARK